MPVITGARAGAINVSAAAGVIQSKMAGEAADSIQVYGLPGTVRSPDPTPQTTPDTVRARVLDSTGAFICHLPHTQGLRWADEFDTAGAGSIDVRRYDDL